MIYLRPLDQFTATPIAGTEGAVAPFFSPDGRWIAFEDAAGRIKKVPVGGGSVVTIAGDLTGLSARTWGPNNVIILGSERGLFRLPAAGGTPERLTALDSTRGELRHADPLFLPDGKTVAFRISIAQSGNAEVTRIGLVPVDAAPPAEGRATHITLDLRGGTPLGYLDGALIVGHPDGTVNAVRVDIPSRRVTGEPVAVLDQVDYSRGLSASLATSGSLVYVRGSGGVRLTLVDERGAVVGRFDEVRRYQHPRFSPDGRRIALTVVSWEAATTDVWIHDVSSGVLSRFTSQGTASRPVWTPNGKRLAYIGQREEGPGELWWGPADRSGPDERLHAMPRGRGGVSEISFSPDGRLAVLRAGAGPPRRNDLWMLPLEGVAGAAQAVRLQETPFSEAMPRISPNGRWLAYVSDETGQYEVYVRAFPGAGGRIQVSSGGGSEPVWAPDGRRLFYRTGDRFVAATLAQPSAAAPGVSVADRRELFEDRYRPSLPFITPAQYDVHPDGRFVVLQSMSEDREIVVVLNWRAELRARLRAAGQR